MIGSTVPRFALLLTAVAALAAGCGGQVAGAPTSSGTAPRAAAAPALPVVATTATTAWSTAPVTVVHHPPVPPVPVVTRVRYAAHAGYDRIVFDIPGALPGYTVKYVSQVIADGSGQPVPVPGSYYLLIVFNPAQAHGDDGTATISGTHRINLPMIKSYVVASDYEGYVSVALGLNAKAGFHVAELSGRVYVDVAA
jgi:hypothetical protein